MEGVLSFINERTSTVRAVWPVLLDNDHDDRWYLGRNRADRLDYNIG